MYRVQSFDYLTNVEEGSSERYWRTGGTDPIPKASALASLDRMDSRWPGIFAPSSHLCRGGLSVGSDESRQTPESSAWGEIRRHDGEIRRNDIYLPSRAFMRCNRYAVAALAVKIIHNQQNCP
jgi:hypothetical protein